MLLLYYWKFSYEGDLSILEAVNKMIPKVYETLGIMLPRQETAVQTLSTENLTARLIKNLNYQEQTFTNS